MTKARRRHIVARVRVVVGVTDNAWADFLRARPHISEANFWLPSTSSGFRALATGEPFLFKTHWPDNRLVGGGFFSGFAQLSIDEAWDIFGEGNGVPSLDALASAIAGYRKEAPDPKTRIGCVLLRDLFFASEGEALPAPADFSKNIVRFKGYDLAQDTFLERHFRMLLGSARSRAAEPDGETLSVAGDTRGLPSLKVPRLGQQAFKSLVLTVYQRRCAITGNKVEPVLQAAHIRPIAEDGQHRVDNGLLLRSDVHILFDRGYLGVDDRHRLQVSPRLRSDFGNGEEFYSRAGQVIAIPERRADRPSRDSVLWHMDTKFLAG